MGMFTATEEVKAEKRQANLDANADDINDPTTKLRQLLATVMADEDPDARQAGWYSGRSGEGLWLVACGARWEWIRGGV